jgi:hypothetical protein
MALCADFRKTIFGAHVKTPWAVRLFRSLRFVTEQPEFCPEVGLIPLSSCSFLVNSAVFATFIGVKRNSLNRDFQQHGFVRELCSQPPTSEPALRHWTKRTFKYGPFNAQCTEEETCLASLYAKQYRLRAGPVESNWVPPGDNGTFQIESFADSADCCTELFEEFEL